MRKVLFLSVALLGMSGLLTSCDTGDGIIEEFWARLSEVEMVIVKNKYYYESVCTVKPSGAYTLNGQVLLKHEIFCLVDFQNPLTSYFDNEGKNGGYDNSEFETPTVDPEYSVLLSVYTPGRKKLQAGNEALDWRCYQYKYSGVEPKDCTLVDQFKGIDIYLLNGKYYCYFDDYDQCYALNKMQDEKGNTIYWSCLMATYKFERYPVQVL